MEAFAPPWVQAIARVFERVGQPLWMVGGAVRNPLMGIPVSDMDMCGPATPPEVLAFCQGTGVRAVLRAAHFGTVELHVRDELGGHMAEYTTFREDSYRCGHRPEAVKFAKELSVDALRRDFSVNALYRRCLGDGLGPVDDPTGGLGHMEKGMLHTVTENPDQVFKDDGLRILRAARFQAELGLAPTASLLASAARHVTLLHDIAPERLHEELAKVLMADFRYPMLRRAVPATGSGLDTIHHIGAWPYLFGDLGYDREAAEALWGWLPPEGISPIPARLILLFWREETEDLGRVLEKLRFSVKERQEAQRLGTALGWAVRGGITGRGELSPFEGAQAGFLVLEFVISALGALGQKEAGEKIRELRDSLRSRRVPTTLRELAVHGEDLLPLCEERGLPPVHLGALLTELWRAMAEDGLENERETLMAAAVAWVQRKATQG